MINLKDANGKHVAITENEFQRAFIDNMGTLMGMSLEAISAFRAEYMAKDGVLPITPERVKGMMK